MTHMDIYQHDGSTTFRLVLRGDLVDVYVEELESAWTTAKSILDGKELLVDITAVSNTDTPALRLLRRMQEAGAHIHPAPPLEAARTLQVLTTETRGWKFWKTRRAI